MRLSLALLAVAALAVTVRAQDVEVVSYFPDNPTTEFFPGKLVTAVLGVRNTGSVPVNVSYAAANLASPYNASINIYNFTGQFLGNTPLGSGEETSVEYGIFFPRQLPPREFILQMQFYYAVGAEQFLAKLFYNETISVIEEATWLDTQLWGLVLIALASAAGIAYWVLEKARSMGYIKKAKKGGAGARSSSAPVKDEWLHGTAADPRKKKQG